MSMLPLFLKLTGRDVLLVGEGDVARAKRERLERTGATVRSVPSSEFRDELIDDVWLVVTAADAEVNARVARAAEARHVFVNAVDDPANASAYLTGLIERDAVTIAISTEGIAPGLAGLVREAVDALLPDDLDRWVAESQRLRTAWRRDGVPLEERRPLLLEALNRLYQHEAGVVR